MRAWRLLRSPSADPRRRCTSRRDHCRMVSPPCCWCDRFMATDASGYAQKSLEKRSDNMCEDPPYDRRRFLGITAMTMAAAHLGTRDVAHAQSRTTPPAALPTRTPGTHTSFDALKQIEAGVLNVGYAEAGPAAGPAVLLLHGWPYDIYSYVDVAPGLASAGYRVIVPYLRGYGTTRFLSNATPRNGQPSVLAVDLVALMDALHIEKAILAGYDWGARTANIIAALW